MKATSTCLILIAAALGACGKKKTAPAAEETAAVPAAPAPVPVPTAHLDAAALERAVKAIDTDPSKVTPPDTVAARLTATLGAPTVVDPARADAHELTWAVIGPDTCDELRFDVEHGAAHATLDKLVRGGNGDEDLVACIDAARGSTQGRRFLDAYRALNVIDPSTEAAATTQLEKLVGKPSLRAEQAGKVRLVWAAVRADQCLYLVATIEDGSIGELTDAPPAGTPRYAECRDWAAGKSTSVWADDLGTTAQSRR